MARIPQILVTLGAAAAGVVLGRASRRPNLAGNRDPHLASGVQPLIGNRDPHMAAAVPDDPSDGNSDPH